MPKSRNRKKKDYLVTKNNHLLIKDDKEIIIKKVVSKNEDMKRIKDIIPHIEKFQNFEDLIDFVSNEIAKTQNGDYNLQSIKGNVYEAIGQLIVFMKSSDFGKVEYYEGNINKDSIVRINSLKQILYTKIQSGNASGFSDLHFKKDDQWYISTSKYFVSNNKKLTDYDLLKLDGITSNIDELSDAKYLVFVKNKKDFVNTFNSANSSSTDIYKNRIDLEKFVFGLEEIQPWYENLRNLIIDNKFDLDYIDSEYIDTDRVPYTPFYNQSLAITWLLNEIYNSKIGKRKRKLLLDVLQGQGKTFIIFGLMIENIRKGRDWNYILTTNRPSLFHQWSEPIYQFLGLERMKVIDYLRDRDKYTDEEWNKMIEEGNNFILLSIQAARNIMNEKYSDIRNIEFDMEIRDESQEASETKLSLEKLEHINSNIKVFLSGTPQKNIYYQAISGYFDSMFHWNMMDLFNVIKTGYHKGIKVDKRSLDWYRELPGLGYFIDEWDEEFVKKLHESGYPKELYPTPQKVFEVKNGKFVYESAIEYWIEKQLGDSLMKTGWLFDKNYIKGTTIITFDNKEQQTQFKKLLDKTINGFSKTFEVHIINSAEYSSKELRNIKNLPYGSDGRILLIVDQLRVGTNIKGKSTKDLKDDLDAHTIIKLDSKSSYPINFQTDGRLLRKYNGYFGKKTKVRVIDPWVYRGYNCYNNIILSNIKRGDDVEKTTFEMLKSLSFYHNGTRISDSTEEWIEMLTRYTDSDYYNQDKASMKFKSTWNISESIEHFDLVKLLPTSGDIKGDNKEDGVGDKDKKGKSKKITSKGEGKSEEEKLSLEEIKSRIKTVYNSLFYLPFLTKFEYKNIHNILNNLHKNFIYIKGKKYNAKSFYEKHILGCSISIFRQLLDEKCLNESGINNYLNNFSDDYEKINEDKLSIVERLESIYNLIDEYRSISTIEKKKYGEVFSPFELIQEMLDTLPKEVWSDSNLKWLDPANGVGNFPIIIIMRLMDGLKDKIEDEEKRYKHIVEKMIYVCDIQPKNNFIFTQLFGGINKKEYNLNIYQYSFLDKGGFDKHMKEVWCLDKFDIIVGNPPYNNGTQSVSEVLWIKFIKKSIKNSELVLLVTPKTWCNLNENSFDKELYHIFKYFLKYANISNCIAKEHFKGVGSTFSYYVLDTKKKNHIFELKTDNGVFVLDYNKIMFVPQIFNELTSSILKKTLFSDNKKISGIFKEITGYRKGGKYIKEDGNFKVSNTSSQYSKNNWLFTDNQQDIMTKPKVIFSDSGYNKPYYDNGEINLGHHSRAFFVKNEEESKKLINFLNSDLVKFLSMLMVSTGSCVGFERFVNLIPNDYEGIKLTEEEIKFIEKIVK